MQQPAPMYPVMPSFPPTNITTEQIQKGGHDVKSLKNELVSVPPDYVSYGWAPKNAVTYLDENKKLILAILDNQNLGKLAECAQYQAQLQKNLMYLAAIADAQPQTPAMPTQLSPHPTMQQGGYYMQHPQAAHQQGMFQPRPPFNNPHPLQDPHNNHQQASQGPMGLRPNNSMNPAHNDTNLVPASNSGLNDIRKQDKPDGRATASSDGPGNSGVHGGEEPK